MPTNPNAPPPSGRDERLADRVAALERRLRNLEPLVADSIPVVATVGALPTAGRAGRLRMVQATGALYKDTGSSWVTPP